VVGNSVVSFKLDKLGAPYGAVSGQVTIQSASQMADVELRQLVPLSAKKTYRLSFWAKASTLRGLILCLTENRSPWGNLGLWKNVQLSSKWQKFEFVFTATATDPAARFTFRLGRQNSTVWLDGVTISQ
jgi:hypothetical protein